MVMTSNTEGSRFRPNAWSTDSMRHQSRNPCGRIRSTMAAAGTRVGCPGISKANSCDENLNVYVWTNHVSDLSPGSHP